MLTPNPKIRSAVQTLDSMFNMRMIESLPHPASPLAVLPLIPGNARSPLGLLRLSRTWMQSYCSLPWLLEQLCTSLITQNIHSKQTASQ